MLLYVELSEQSTFILERPRDFVKLQRMDTPKERKACTSTLYLTDKNISRFVAFIDDIEYVAAVVGTVKNQIKELKHKNLSKVEIFYGDSNLVQISLQKFTVY